MLDRMHVVHVVGSTDRAGAGVAASVCELCGALSGVAQVTIVAGSDGKALYPVDGRVRRVLCPNRPIAGRCLVAGVGLRRELERVLDEGADLVHVHGIWLAANHAGCVAARRRDIPYIVSAHGMLMPWAFRHQAWKKKLPWLLYQRADLLHAAAVVGTSEAEADAIRAFGFPGATVMVPHGLALLSWEAPRNGIQPRKVVFLGRLHPIKGLMNLLDAWALLRPGGWRLILAGPEEDGFQAVLTERIRQHGLADTVTFAGPVDDRQKWLLLRQADLTVLPSFMENFGLVVLESLACGVPVITTRGTPWQVLETERCGWWVDAGAEALARGLRAAMTLTDEERQAMGLRGRALVAKRFAWDRIAGEMADVYRWICGSGKQPDICRPVTRPPGLPKGIDESMTAR